MISPASRAQWSPQTTIVLQILISSNDLKTRIPLHRMPLRGLLSGTQSVVLLRPAALPGSLLERQSLGPHPDLRGPMPLFI